MTSFLPREGNVETKHRKTLLSYVVRSTENYYSEEYLNFDEEEQSAARDVVVVGILAMYASRDFEKKGFENLAKKIGREAMRNFAEKVSNPKYQELRIKK